MACLVNDFASFDTPEDPGGASIVERKDFQAKQPLCVCILDPETNFKHGFSFLGHFGISIILSYFSVYFFFIFSWKKQMKKEST